MALPQGPVRLAFLAVAGILLLALALATRGFERVAAEERLANGGFEEDTAGWFPVDLDFDTTCAGDGSPAAARLTAHAGPGRLVSSPIAIDPSAPYVVAASVSLAEGASQGTKVWIELTWWETNDGTAPLLAKTSPANLAWEPPGASYLHRDETVSPLPGAGSVRLVVNLSGPEAASVCVDDLSFDGPPPPTPTTTATASPTSTATLPPTATATLTPTPAPTAMPIGALLNGGFEEGDAEGRPVAWRKFGGSLERTGESPHSGEYAGAFTSLTDSTKWVYQALGVSGGSAYRFEGHARVAATGSRVWLRVSWYESSDASGSAAGSSDSPDSLTGPSDGYALLTTGSVIAPAGARSARARVMLAPASSAPETVLLDDFSFVETAPPTPTRTPTVGPTAASTLTATPTPSPSPRPSEPPAPQPTIAHGRLLNGGFEEASAEGRPLAWRTFGGTLARTAESPHSGKYAGAFTSETESTKWVYQVVYGLSGGAYAFEGYVRAPDPGAQVWLRVSWHKSEDGTGPAIGSTDSGESLIGPVEGYRWLGTGAVMPPAGARSARVRVMLAPATAESETIFIDDLSFAATTATPVQGEEAPEEPTALLSEASSSRTSRRERAGTQAEGAPPSTGPAPAAGSPHLVKISEVLYQPAEGEEAPREWVELYNAGPRPVELAGWSLADNVSSDRLPSGTLPPGGFLVVAGGQAMRRDFPNVAGTPVYLEDGEIGNGLANDGDRLVLRDTDGRLADALSYGDDRGVFDPPVEPAGAGHSLERSDPGVDTDTAADFRDNDRPSPGLGPRALAPTATPRPTPLSEARGAETQRHRGGGPPWFWLIVGGLAFFGAGAGAAGLTIWAWRRRP